MPYISVALRPLANSETLRHNEATDRSLLKTKFIVLQKTLTQTTQYQQITTLKTQKQSHQCQKL